MTRLLALMMATLSLSACVVYDEPPRGPRRVVVHERYDYVQPVRVAPYRCPPGHARKGWC